jgi:hypothetical protein
MRCDSNHGFPLIYMNDTLGNPLDFQIRRCLRKLSAPALRQYGQDDPWVALQQFLQSISVGGVMQETGFTPGPDQALVSV